MKSGNSKSKAPRWFDRLFSRFPKLERDGRIELSESIEMGAKGGADYIVMMLLSSSLASFGLIQGATAVVIGAIGIAITNGSPLIAGNAAILLVTNIVAIILGSAIIFRLFGVQTAMAAMSITCLSATSSAFSLSSGRPTRERLLHHPKAEATMPMMQGLKPSCFRTEFKSHRTLNFDRCGTFRIVSMPWFLRYSHLMGKDDWWKVSH